MRGVGRVANPEDPHVDEWAVADLSTGIPADTLAGASVVVHAAAETAGGYDAHQRNTIDATRHLLQAMREAAVSRLDPREQPVGAAGRRGRLGAPARRDAAAFRSAALCPYVWGKSLQEELVEREAASLGISTRIIRPGALVDWRKPELPGVMGRQLFGRWHLGLGRASLPIAVCDVGRCAEAIAWCAKHFDDAPAVVNLFDPALTTRGSVVERLREHGWKGQIVWVPISAISVGLMTARAMASLRHGRLPEKLAAWSILRPRHYDSGVAATLLEATRVDVPAGVPLHV